MNYDRLPTLFVVGVAIGVALSIAVVELLIN